MATPAENVEIRTWLEHVLESEEFRAKRRGDMLRYIVERTLEGGADRLTEYAIGLDVFHKPDSFDPRVESTVRAEMTRLRKALATYYSNGGASDPIRFEFPNRGYTPVLRKQEPQATPLIKRTIRWRTAGLVGAAALVLAGAGVTYHLTHRLAKHIPDPAAVELVQKASVGGGYGTKESFDRIVVLLNQALEKDPNYAEAWAGLATAYAGAGTNSLVDPAGAAKNAKADAARAIALDPDSAVAWGAMGYADAMLINDWSRGIDEMRRAERLAPDNGIVRQHLALALLALGRFDEATAEAKATIERVPSSPAADSTIGMIEFMQRHYKNAETEWRRVLSLHPGAVITHGLIGMAVEAQGRYEEAEREYRMLPASESVGMEMRLMHLDAVRGRKAEARAAAERLGPDHPDQPLDFAATWAAAGDMEKAFQWLDHVEERHATYLLKVHPFLDPLRQDPRYAAYLKRAGFQDHGL